MNTRGLISELSNCIYHCGHCAASCLNEENSQHLRQCILTDLDCADYCSLLLNSLSRRSPLARELIGKCIDVCEACERECNKHDHDHCKECADACRDCANACRDHLETLKN